MKTLKSLVITLMISTVIQATETHDRQGWHLSTFMGISKSINNKIAFHLNDQPDQIFDAEYINRSFEDSHWWAFRVEDWTGNTARGFELIHHKIYLDNTNSVIENFSISDGYNLLYYNFGRASGKNIYRIGVGVVIAHADTTISGRERYIVKGFKGHKVAGPSVQLNHERWLWENDKYFISIDSKVSFSYAVAPISASQNEYVVAPDMAFHISFGLGAKANTLKQNGYKKAEFLAPLLYPAISGRLFLGTGLLPEDYNL